MDLYAALGALLILGLVAANGFFVATEFAIVAVRRSRLEQLAAEGNAGAGAAWQVVGHLDTYIAACQLGVTMASLALGWVGEPALEHLIEPPLELIFGPLAPTLADGIALGLAFVLITALHIILGELAPKGLALQRPEGTALWVARPMLVFERVFRWPIGALNAVGNSVLRLFGLDPATGHEMVHSVEELRLLVTGSREAGVVEESEARIASRAFGFGELTAGELMTPRTELEAIPIGAARDELLRRVAASTHSRLPVYDGTLDNIVGVLHVHDLFAILQPVPDRFDLRPLIRPVLAVPASKSANDLLEEMRAARRQLAVAIDEYGGTAGIVTLEDLLEALVGPIEDEPPVADETRSATEPVEVGDGTLLYDGLMRLGEWEEATGRRLAASDHEHSDTLGGLIMARLGRIPRPGDEVVIADRTLRVERLDGKRVAAVRLID